MITLKQARRMHAKALRKVSRAARARNRYYINTCDKTYDMHVWHALDVALSAAHGHARNMKVLVGRLIHQAACRKLVWVVDEASYFDRLTPMPELGR